VARSRAHPSGPAADSTPKSTRSRQRRLNTTTRTR
jgi:hypothetical protein